MALAAWIMVVLFSFRSECDTIHRPGMNSKIFVFAALCIYLLAGKVN